METVGKYLTILRRFIKKHGKEYGIVRMGIFGSVARGEHTECSDIDIYYEGEPIGLLDSRDLHGDLEKELGVPVDLIRKHTNLRPTFLEQINKDIIYV